MKNSPDANWQPDPQLLAAYFDGELEGRDDIADVRARIECWLETHPEAKQEWASHQRLQKVWLDTTPAEPSTAVWKQTVERIDAERRRPAAVPASRRPWLTAGIGAASVVLFIGLLYGSVHTYLAINGNLDALVKTPQPNPLDDNDVLVMASADDVLILRIEDADAVSVVIGTFPVSAPLELAASGEVCITCKCPRVVVRQDPPHRPMVYAAAE